MSIQNWSESIIFVKLAKEPQMGEELETTIRLVESESDQSVIVDFADVDIVTSSSIAKLLKLRKILREQGNTLVLSSVSSRTHKIFAVAGLEHVFEFVEDQFIALAGLQLAV